MMMMTRQNKMMKEKEAEFQQTIKKLTQQNMMMKEKESEFQQIIKELTQENKMMDSKLRSTKARPRPPAPPCMSAD